MLQMPITQNLMPMGRAAAANGGSANMLPPMPPGQQPAQPPTMNSAGPLPSSPMPSFPSPSAPSTPPYAVKLQPDGSSIYVMNGANGPVVLGVNQAPKMPKMPAPQGVPVAMQMPQQ